MRRITKFTLATLATLMALQFFVVATPAAPALGTQVAVESGTTTGGVEEAALLGQEYATCALADHAYPKGAPRSRERGRTATDSPRHPVTHPPLTSASLGRMPVDTPLSWESKPHLGSSTAHSRSALQVFLC